LDNNITCSNINCSYDIFKK